MSSQAALDQSLPAIGLDVGGTKIAGGVVDGRGVIIDREIVPTPAGEDGGATVAAIQKLVNTLHDRHPSVVAVGVGAAGLVEWPGGRIRWAPNNSYRDLPLRELLVEGTGLPAVVDNDANVAVWGESRFGAAAGHGDVVLVTVGTGVGGGVVLDGGLHRGTSGIGGELGHITVDVEGPACACGNNGCLESLASGTALGRMGREAAAADPDGRLAALAGSPDRVKGVHVTMAAREGDPVAARLFRRLGFWLGVGLASMVTVFDPAVLVLGGGLVTSGDLLLDPARESMNRFVFARDHRDLPALLPARLGPDAGLVGAADLARHHAR